MHWQEPNIKYKLDSSERCPGYCKLVVRGRDCQYSISHSSYLIRADTSVCTEFTVRYLPYLRY